MVLTIIVTYNALKWIDRCLGSLRLSTVPTDAVVIDNASTDETVDYIRQHYPDVQLVPQDKNLGFGQANNIGLRKALQENYDHVLLLNQDAYIAPDMLAKLLDHTDTESLVSPVHMNGEGNKMDVKFYLNSWLQSPLKSFSTDAIPSIEGRYPALFINAACWLIPTAILTEVGGFSPLYFHYVEDNDYVQRLQFHHKGVYIVPQAVVYHDRVNIAHPAPTEQYLYHLLLLRAVDIRRNRLCCLLRRWRTELGVIYHAIKERRGQDIRYLCRALSRFYANHSTIAPNRAIIKEKGPHWLVV